mmetsp:Transcript_22720/g.35573  ORF Transcript_22720/g.35573 Transcript_22720/m.35573 type:complete len:468 (+) Transcript_22720:87-1490(+)
MPLGKRFQKELVPEWQKQCIDYKGLKRRAESLVGRDEGEVQAWEAEEFREHFVAEIEKVTQMYNKQERKLCRFYCSLEAKIDALFQRLDGDIQESSPHNPTAVDGPQERTRSIDVAALFSGNSKDRQIPIAIMAFMVHIDALRSFALLNTLAVLKIAHHHCSKTVCRLVLRRLTQEPFYNCYRLMSLVEELDELSKKFVSTVFDVSSDCQSESSEDTCSVCSHDGRSSDRFASQESLSAYCTWKNQNCKLPPWVCQDADKKTWGSDIRTISVRALVATFMEKLGSRLKERGLGQVVPGLVQQFQQLRGQKQQSNQAQKIRVSSGPAQESCGSGHKVQAGNQIPPGPAVPQDRIRQAVAPRDGNAPAPGVRREQTQLRTSRSCRDLTSLAIGSDEGLGRGGYSNICSFESPEFTLHVNSPPYGAMGEASAEKMGMEAWPCEGGDYARESGGGLRRTDARRNWGMSFAT